MVIFDSNGKVYLESRKYPCETTYIYTPSIVITDDATNVGKTTATLNGTIIYGTGIIDYVGFCWSTTINPTIDNSNITYTGQTTLTHNLTGLIQGTTYYYRAFAHDNGVFIYGDNKTIYSQLQLGDTYGGGKIVYIDPGQTTGLVCGNYGPIPGWENGLYQTEAINYCYNLVEGGFSDWYLPSVTELCNISYNVYLYNNGHPEYNLGFLYSVMYWSGTYCNDFGYCGIMVGVGNGPSCYQSKRININFHGACLPVRYVSFT